MEKTKVKVDFGITGESFSVNDITQTLNITPSFSWVKGETRKLGKLSKIMKHTYWDIATVEEESLDIDNQLFQIYTVLKDKKGALEVIKEKYRVDFTISVLIHIENGEFPVICLKKWIIDFAHDIQAEIEFSPYYFS